MVVETAFIFQNIGTVFSDFFRTIRIVDILDIAIIAFFLYIILNWLRQSASRRSLLSFGILIIVYVVARFTGMYLTERLLEGLFVIILIGFVVIFQSDMRRIIDRLGSWSFFKKPSTNSALDLVTNILTEACAKMAEQRRGALIAIKGSETWDRHLHGGIELDGLATIPLLHSIFNTKAPGHDGAVLLEGRKIIKFGVHLPLSTHLDKMKHGGTRHTAALGLAEQCDALVVVVSEERGIISIAQNGQIKELDSPGDLKKYLDDFWNDHYRSSSTSFIQWWKRRSLLTALASVLLALAMWWAFAYPSGTVFRSYSFPIEFRHLQDSGVALQDSLPSNIRVTLSGTDQAFKTFSPSNSVVSIDLAKKQSQHGTLQITKEDVSLPNDLHFIEASPSRLSLKNSGMIKTRRPVKVVTTGQLRDGLKLISITASPKEMTVWVDSTRAGTDSVETEAIDLSLIQKSSRLQKRIREQAHKMELPDNQSSQVLIDIEVTKNNQ